LTNQPGAVHARLAFQPCEVTVVGQIGPHPAPAGVCLVGLFVPSHDAPRRMRPAPRCPRSQRGPSTVHLRAVRGANAPPLAAAPVAGTMPGPPPRPPHTGSSGRRGHRRLAFQPAVVEPAARLGWLLLIFGPLSGIAAVQRGGSHDQRDTHAVRRRLRRAAARRRLLLDVRHPPAAHPDGARWGPCLRRRPVVLPRHPGMHRTLDLSPAPGTGRRRCPRGWRYHSPITQATKPAAPGPAIPAAIPGP
jgi:hypothetical protein